MGQFIQTNFSRGEIAPALFGRVDLKQYTASLKKASNMTVHQFGGVSNRAGLHFVGPVKDHTKQTRLIPFQFKTTDTHIIEVGDSYIRIIRDDGHVTETSVAISNATQANPVVVTTATHSYTSGDEVFIDSIVGMTELNGRRFKITVLTATTFSLQDVFSGSNVDGTGFTAYTSGGTSARIHEVATPWVESELRDLKFTQSADVMTIVHPDHRPRELVRNALNDWQLDVISFAPDVSFPTNIDATGGSSAVTTQWAITAISDTDEESLAGTGVDPAPATISGITQADPAVVTATAHPFSNGDYVYLSGIVGMTELNNRQFVVANSATNTFELLGEDSTNHTAYSSGGTVDPMYVEHTNETDVALSWDAVTDAVRYRIFKKSQGVFGFIASTTANSYTDDNSITPDIDDTPPIQKEPFRNTDDRPGAVGYFQQRLVMGGSNNKPDTTYASTVGAFHNFAAASPIRADDAFSFTLASTQVNDIRHYVALNKLIIFTSGQEWAADSGTNPFTIDNINLVPQSNWGSSDLPPIIVGNTVLYVQDGTGFVRALKFSLEIDSFKTDNLSILVPHLFEDKAMLEWGFTRSPEPIIYLVRDDGMLNTLTFNEEQEVIGWTTWETDGDFESVAAIRPSITDSFHSAYFVVQRTINGNTVRLIERTDSRKFTDVRDCFFVDSGLSLDAPIDITGATAANPVVITATSHGFTDGDEVDIFDIVWEPDVDQFDTETQPDQLNTKRFLVSNSTTNTFELQDLTGTDIDGSAFNAYVSGGTVRLATDTISGLWHLANTPVSVLADGNVISNLTVASDGTLTLPRKFSRVHIGLGYVSEIETLNPESANPRAGITTIQGHHKKISELIVRLDKSRGLFVGFDTDNFQEMKQREFELLGDPTDLLTGDKDMRIPSTWNRNGRLTFRQIYPLPLTILAIMFNMEVGDR